MSYYEYNGIIVALHHIPDYLQYEYDASRDSFISKTHVERHNLVVASATVRNDMADLEDDGLIAAPHTSSGRIPTDKGYRYFVDRISEVRPLSIAERRAVKT